jgi:hypothetical protein
MDLTGLSDREDGVHVAWGSSTCQLLWVLLPKKFDTFSKTKF